MNCLSEFCEWVGQASDLRTQQGVSVNWSEKLLQATYLEVHCAACRAITRVESIERDASSGEFEYCS